MPLTPDPLDVSPLNFPLKPARTAIQHIFIAPQMKAQIRSKCQAGKPARLFHRGTRHGFHTLFHLDKRGPQCFAVEFVAAQRGKKIAERNEK